MNKPFYTGPNDNFTLEKNEELYAAINELDKRITQKARDQKHLAAFNQKIEAQILEILKQTDRFLKVKNQRMTKSNMQQKKQAYHEYKTFISKYQNLPEIEREYFIVKLEERQKKSKKQMRENLEPEYLGFTRHRHLIRVAQTAIESIQGKNQTIETVILGIENNK